MIERNELLMLAKLRNSSTQQQRSWRRGDKIKKWQLLAEQHWLSLLRKRFATVNKSEDFWTYHS